MSMCCHHNFSGLSSLLDRHRVDVCSPSPSQACWEILISLRSASPVAALSVQSTSTLHPCLVVCGPCCLLALTWTDVPGRYSFPSFIKSPSLRYSAYLIPSSLPGRVTEPGF